MTLAHRRELSGHRVSSVVAAAEVMLELSSRGASGERGDVGRLTQRSKWDIVHKSSIAVGRGIDCLDPG